MLADAPIAAVDGAVTPPVPPFTRLKRTDDTPLALTPTRTVWTLPLNAHLIQPPAYDDDHGYFAIEGGHIVAYDLWPGTREWIVDAQPESAMTAGGGFVFFAAGQHLVALDASDGSVAWTAALNDRIRAAPAWANGWLIVATAEGQVAAFRATDGSSIWWHDAGSPAHASPAIAGDRVYVPLEASTVVALQIETGGQVWERRLGGMPNDILAANDRLFVGATDHYIYCIDTADGRVDWRMRAGSEVTGLVAIDERRVYVVSLDNVVRALSRSHGVQQWIQMLKLRPMGGPVKAGGTMVVHGVQPPIRAFDVADGKPAGDIAVTGSEIAAPIHALTSQSQVPALVVVTRDVAGGDTVTLLGRSVDPPVTPFAALANPLSAAPALSPGG